MSNAPDLFGFTGFFSNELKDADPDIYNALGGELVVTSVNREILCSL